MDPELVAFNLLWKGEVSTPRPLPVESPFDRAAFYATLELTLGAIERLSWNAPSAAVCRELRRIRECLLLAAAEELEDLRQDIIDGRAGL